MKKASFTKVLSLILAGVMLLGLAACGGKQSGEPQNTQEAANTPEPTEAAETEPAATEPAETEPAETEPAETEPAETEPAQHASVTFEGNFMELKLDTPVLVDMDGDGADDTVLVTNTVVGDYYDYYHTVTITLAANPDKPYVDKIERCAEFSGALTDSDRSDGRRELVFCFDAESNDYETFVYRVNASGEVEKFGEAMYFGTGISYYEGFPEDFVFDPAEGLPCSKRTEILGTYYVAGSFTVTAEGIKSVTGMYAYPDMADGYSNGRLTLLKELKLTLLDNRLNEKGEITLPVGSMIYPRYTDRESWVIVELEDGRLAKASVLIVDSGDEWGIYINDILQDDLAEIPYAD